MEKPNYFNQWGKSWPVVALIVMSVIGAGLLSGLVAGVFGFLIEVTGLVKPAVGSSRWTYYAWGVSMVATVPVVVNNGLRSWYRDRFREEDRAEAAEWAQIEAENQAALESGGEAALARLRNDRFMAEQKRGLFAAFR